MIDVRNRNGHDVIRVLMIGRQFWIRPVRAQYDGMCFGVLSQHRVAVQHLSVIRVGSLAPKPGEPKGAASARRSVRRTFLPCFPVWLIGRQCWDDAALALPSRDLVRRLVGNFLEAGVVGRVDQLSTTKAILAKISFFPTLLLRPYINGISSYQLQPSLPPLHTGSNAPSSAFMAGYFIYKPTELHRDCLQMTRLLVSELSWFQRFTELKHRLIGDKYGSTLGSISTRSAVSAMLLVLASCGGGGGGNQDGGTRASAQSFPLQSGWVAKIRSGSQVGYTVSGNCVGFGSASDTTSTPTPATFEGVSGISVTNRKAISLFQCGPTSYTSSVSTDYYDNNYVQLGTVDSGGNYSVFLTPPSMPAQVKVGDAGSIGTEVHYADNTKSVQDGWDVISYVIEPDSTNTAIVDIITKSYNSGSVLLAIEQDRYKIATDGALTPVSSDIQFENGSTLHLVLTVIPNPPLFMTMAYVPTESQPSAVAIGDVNGDGRNDVVMTTSALAGDIVNDYKLFVFLQDGSGMLSTPVLYATESTYTCRSSSVVVGDINNDGRNDVVIGESGCGVEVFTQNPSGNLNAGIVYSSTDSDKVRIADLNHDGLLDVVGIGWGTNTASVWLQSAGGSLNLPVLHNVTHGGYDDLEVGDINNDGLADVVVMSGQGLTGNIGILTQTSAGGLNVPTYYGVGANILLNGVSIGDVNGDGLNDVVVTYGGNRPYSMIGVLAQNALGALSSVVSYASYDIPTPVEMADVTGDGLDDVITLHSGWINAGVYVQSTNGTLQSELLYGLAPVFSTYNPASLAIGDINSDGESDIVNADPGLGLVMLYHH